MKRINKKSNFIVFADDKGAWRLKVSKVKTYTDKIKFELNFTRDALCAPKNKEAKIFEFDFDEFLSVLSNEYEKRKKSLV